MKGKKIFIILISLIIIESISIIILLTLVYYELVPKGVGLKNAYAFLEFSVDYGYFTSPDRTHTIHCLVNDAGAMHSGNYWTWFVEDTDFCGKRIVAQGYISSDLINNNVIPLHWGKDGTFSVDFVKGQYNSDTISCIVVP